jgi:tetratricopeptide (TPR) repeat protein
MRWLLCSLVCALLIALVPSAHAEDAARERREAKRFFDQAHLAYRRGDYEEAILKWQESYELSKEPLIFESIANAYERLGDLEAAREYLKKWRDRAPADEHKELDSRLDNLEGRIEERRAAQRRQSEAEAQRREQEERERARTEEERRNKTVAKSAASTGAVLETTGWALVGVGGAAVLAGIITDAVAASRRPDRADACEDSDDATLCRDEFRDDIEASNTLAIAGDVTWIAGAVVAATGVALVIAGRLQHEANESARVELVPRVSAQGFGLAIGGRY